MPASTCGKETLGAALGPFKAFGATIQPAARAAPHAGVGWCETLGGSIAATLAGRRPQVRGEDHGVSEFAEFAGVLFNPPILSVFDLLPSCFTSSIASSDDIRRHLWDIGGVVP